MMPFFVLRLPERALGAVLLTVTVLPLHVILLALLLGIPMSVMAAQMVQLGLVTKAVYPCC